MSFLVINFFDTQTAFSQGAPPAILSYQGRLTDSSGDLLGGSSGTNYYFKFSIWDASTGGSKLWPTASPTSYETTVRSGVFSVAIGDTANGYPDTLDYDFSNSVIYLQVEVSSDDDTFETLTPRQRITSSAFSLVASSVRGSGDSTLGNATSTNLFSTTASSTNLFSTFATLGSLITNSLSTTEATTTNFAVSGSSQVGTVISGLWQGTAIGDAYLTKSGDWTGTFDGQEGIYYLSRANHTGTQVASTISDFDISVEAVLTATTTLPNLTTLTGLTDLISTRSTTTNATTTYFHVANNQTVGGSITLGGALIIPYTAGSSGQTFNQITTSDTGNFGFRVGRGQTGTAGGIWRGNTAYFVCDGNSNACVVRENAALSWGTAELAAPTVSLYRDANDTLALRRQNNTQEFRIYNFDSTDDEFVSLGFKNNSNVFTIETEATGAASVRPIALLGGNVGIGVVDPSERLHIDGNLLVTGNSTTTNATTTSLYSSKLTVDENLTINGTFTNRRNDPNAMFELFPQGGTGGRDWWVGATRSDSGIAPAGTFFVWDETATALRLSINSSGRVNIGSVTGVNQSHALTINSPVTTALRLIGPLGSFGHGARLTFGDEGFTYIEETVDDQLSFVSGSFVFAGGPISTGSLVAGNSTTTNLFVSNALVVGDNSGASDATLQFASDSNVWSMGYNSTDKTFRIASSTNLTSNAYFQIGKSGTTTLNSAITSSSAGQYLCIDATTFEVIRNTSACSGSSIRLKDNIADLDYGLETVSLLRPVVFTFKPETGFGTSTQLGFIAEEVYELIPELVSLDKNGQPTGLNYPNFTPVLAKAIQDINLNLETVASSMVSTSSPQATAFAERFMEGIFSRLKDWFASTTNGITDFFANRVHTKELCVSDDSGSETCITKAQLDNLLTNTSNYSSNTETTSPVSSEIDSSSNTTTETSTTTTDLIVPEEPIVTEEVQEDQADTTSTTTDTVTITSEPTEDDIIDSNI